MTEASSNDTLDEKNADKMLIVKTSGINANRINELIKVWLGPFFRSMILRFFKLLEVRNGISNTRIYSE
jgi:ABC-type Co2+ transport system permease subunit